MLTPHTTNQQNFESASPTPGHLIRTTCLERIVKNGFLTTVAVAYGAVTENLAVHMYDDNLRDQIIAAIAKCVGLLPVTALAVADLPSAIRKKQGNVIFIDIEAIVGNLVAISGSVLNIFKDQLSVELQKLGLILEVAVPSGLFLALAAQSATTSFKEGKKLDGLLNVGIESGLILSVTGSILSKLDWSLWGLGGVTLCATLLAIKSSLPASWSVSKLCGRCCSLFRGAQADYQKVSQYEQSLIPVATVSSDPPLVTANSALS